MARVLVVDDEPSIRDTLSEFLVSAGYEVRVAESARQATDALGTGSWDVVVTDIVLPELTGVDLLRHVAQAAPHVKVVLITGEPSFETAAEAVRHGAFDYLSKPVTGAAIVRVVAAAVHVKELEDENRLYRDQLEALVEERTRQLRASERGYRELAESSMAAILRVEDRRVAYANPSAARILGLGRDEAGSLRGRHLLDLVHEDDRDEVRATLERLERGNGGVGSLECRVPCGEGKVAWVEALGVRVEHEGRLGVLITAVDVTRRKEVEAERERIEARFLQAQKMEAIGRLAGGIAHDFNNILTAVIGYADCLLVSLGPHHPGRGEAQEIQRAAERAAGLTRQLLAFSRRQIRAPRVLDVNEAIEGSRNMLSRLIGEDIELVFTAHHGPLPLHIDPTQLDQILVNLATNARDALPRGGRVTIETSMGDGAWTGEGSFVQVVFADTGVGMDAAALSRAFEPFFTTKERGTGLGLATVDEIVRQYGGHLAVESAVEVGTTIVIRFPAADAAQLPTRRDAVAAEPRPRGGETVLLVEDDPAVRQVVRTMLESSGYAVLEAREGREALGIVAEHPGRIDVLVSDVVLPGMTGLALLEQLRREQGRLAHLFISGYAEDAIAKQGLLRPGLRLLQKPFGPRDLARALREAIEER